MQNILNSENICDFPQVCNLKGNGLWSRIIREAVKEDGIKTCLFGSEDIRIEVVANHDGRILRCLRDFKGIVKELSGWFVGSRILTENNGIETIV